MKRKAFRRAVWRLRHSLPLGLARRLLNRLWPVIEFAEYHPRVTYVFWMVAIICLTEFIASLPVRTLSSITANTEVLQISQSTSLRGEIFLGPAWITTDSDLVGKCFDNKVFVPAKGAQLTLTRQQFDDLIIEIDPPNGGQAGRLMDGEQPIKAYPETVFLRFSVDNKTCAAQDVIRIPIAGPTTLGADYSAQTTRDQSLVLVSGRIDTYARGSTFLDGGELYPAGSAVFPEGARLRECAVAKDRVDWSGFAEARLRGRDIRDRNIDVSAFTEARELALSTPGGEKAGGVNCNLPTKDRRESAPDLAAREDILGVSLLSRLVADPILSIFALVLGVCFVFLQTFIAMHELRAKTRPKGFGANGDDQ